MSMQVIRPLALALLLGLGNIAIAQPSAVSEPAAPEAESTTPPAPPAAPAIRTDFSDDELQSFIDVNDELATIRADYTSKIQESGDDPAATSALQEEATQKMVEVVEASNLDVDTFNQIAMALQQDEGLMARIQALLDS